jgi:hypothetical protein
MRHSYGFFWKVFFLSLALGVWWSLSGQAWFKKIWTPPHMAEASARNQTHFIALVFPKITRSPAPYTFGRRDFEKILKSLKGLGYTAVGLEDVAGLYFDRRPLPEKSILISFDRDDPKSIRIAEQAMRKFRMRGTVFLSGGGERKGRIKRHWLSQHAIDQMKKSGAWEFGSAVSPNPAYPARNFVFSTPKGELRFSASYTGFNDEQRDPWDLSILSMRSDLDPREAVMRIHGEQPRELEFVDEFNAPLLNRREWTTGWGAVSTTQKKLLLLPTAGRTSASVFLKGTDSWRDFVLEFRLEKYKKNFWAYTRYKDSGHYIRVGVAEGFWLIQQKTGPLAPPSILAKVPIRPDNFPANIRLVLKKDWAVLYLNGVMQFGKALKIDPSIEQGRIQLGVFDNEPRAALAVVSAVKARPLGNKWLAVKSSNFSTPELLERLREEAIDGSVISPLWLKAGKDGDLSLVGEDRETVWSFAGYYRCRLLPTVDLLSWTGSAGNDSAAALQARLLERAAELEVDGLNLLLSETQAKEATPLLQGLREKLHEQDRDLWVTWLDPSIPAFKNEVDGILRPVSHPIPGLDILERVDGSRLAAPLSTPMKKEFAS